MQCALLLSATLLVPHAAAAEGELFFVAHTATGKDVRGLLRGLQLGWSATLAGGETVTVPGGDLISLRRVNGPLPALPVGEHLILANGDRIPIRSPRIVGERLHFTSADLDDGKETSLPLTTVSVLWRTAPERTEDPEALRRRLASGSRSQDVVLLRNGDVLSGVLNSLEGDRAIVEVEKRSVPVPLAQVAAISLSTELSQTLRPKGVYAQLVLTDGGRLSITSASLNDAQLTAQTVFGATLRVPLERVAALDLHGGRAVYLSDLTPAKYEFLPYLDESWPLAHDASVTGHDLRVGGSTYSKGLGVHSHARVQYRLAGAYRRFEAVVGLDDRDGQAGNVHVRVLADGKPLPLGAAAADLSRATGPLAVSVGIEGAQELVLEIDFGKRGNVEDVVNWADARLIR